MFVFIDIDIYCIGHQAREKWSCRVRQRSVGGCLGRLRETFVWQKLSGSYCCPGPPCPPPLSALCLHICHELRCPYMNGRLNLPFGSSCLRNMCNGLRQPGCLCENGPYMGGHFQGNHPPGTRESHQTDHSHPLFVGSIDVSPPPQIMSPTVQAPRTHWNNTSRKLDTMSRPQYGKIQVAGCNHKQARIRSSPKGFSGAKHLRERCSVLPGR